jgi:hypothetical protein
MRVVKGTLLGIGALALAALITTLIAPKVVHAAAEALVQVANTPTTAVPAVEAPAASQIYYGACSVVLNNGYVALCSLPPVPSGQTLFVETVSMQMVPSLAGNMPTQSDIQVPAILGSPYLFVPLVQRASGYYDGTAAVRVPFPAGAEPWCQSWLARGGDYGFMQCAVWGYLAPAQ